MTPDEPQRVPLQRLGLKLPTRLRRIDEVVAQIMEWHRLPEASGALAGTAS